MGLKKYEVKESEFPKKEGTDDFAMSAGFFEYLDRTHNFQSKAAIENYCKYWLDRHSADHPDAAKYNKFALWEQYKDKILHPYKDFVIFTLIAGSLIFILYLAGSFDFGPTESSYVETPTPSYECIVTDKYRVKVDHTEVEFRYGNRFKYFKVISGSNYLEMNNNPKVPLIFKFIDDGVVVDHPSNYERLKISDMTGKKNNSVYIAFDKGVYKQYYVAGGVLTGFFDSYVKIMDNYVIEIE